MKSRLRIWGVRLLCLAMIFATLGMPVAHARYATLEFGSRGSDVLKLQKALLALGFDPNGTDGKFGRGTEKAVIAYQQSRGLTADGKAGHLTLTQLYSETDGSGAGSTGNSGGSTGSGAVSTNPNTLKYGDSGERVRELQQALTKLGYSTNGVDGRFGAGTQRAVIAFQRANGLTADGLAGSKTLNLLFDMANAVNSGSASTGNNGSSGNTDSGSSSGTATLSRTLRKGYTGDDVKQVQTRLKALGYYSGSTDGVYGTGSIAAVKAFQQNNGLTADGLAGQRTFAKLFSSSAVPAGGSSSGSGSASGSGSSGSGSTSGSGSSTGSSSGAYITLRSGATGDDVKKLQKALQKLNYNVSADGNYGPLTVAAVSEFQRINGLSVDGVAGAQTQALLYSGNGKKYESSGVTSPDDYGTATGPNKSKVKLLHWFNDIKPTIKSGQKITVFDPATDLQWTLRLYSLGRHADSEPLTAEDTAIMFKAFGYKNTWTPKPVYVKLPTGVWTLASMHNVPHLSGSIKDNDFDGHLCVHFLRDMDECKKNDPNYGVTNQNAIRKAWKEMTGVVVD